MEQGLARWAHNPKVGGSNPLPAIFGGIAQLVEQRDHNPLVAGSSPAAAKTLTGRQDGDSVTSQKLMA